MLFFLDRNLRAGQRDGVVLQVVADLALPPVADGGRHGSKIDPSSGQERPLVVVPFQNQCKKICLSNVVVVVVVKVATMNFSGPRFST